MIIYSVSEMKTWFSFFDKNGDGKLDKNELKKVFYAMCWNVTDEEFEKVFETVDTDGRF